jgi:hypothetical protein
VEECGHERPGVTGGAAEILSASGRIFLPGEQRDHIREPQHMVACAWVWRHMVGRRRGTFVARAAAAEKWRPLWLFDLERTDT